MVSDNNTQPFLIFLFCFLFMSTTQSVFAVCLQVFVGAAEVLVAKETIIG